MAHQLRSLPLKFNVSKERVDFQKNHFRMGLIYGVTWYSMSLAMPGLFSMNAILKNQSEESERTITNLSFWLKYWVVFAYYFVLEFVLDCFISWVPFYSEVINKNENHK